MVRVTAFSLLIFFIGTTLVFADKTAGNKEIIVLDKGVKRSVSVPETLQEKRSTGSDTARKKGIIIAFKRSREVDIETFETKYGLKFKDKLVIGYYIFENVSSQDDTEIIRSIMKNEKNIKTLKPNWKKNNQPR